VIETDWRSAMSSIIGRYSIRVRGQFACFTRPEFKTERLSYEVLTPSAARGILEAILWKPAIYWDIRRIRLLSPVRFVQFKRNEVNSRVATPKAATASRTGAVIDNYFADEDRAQRNTVALRDVDYAIDAEIVMTSRAGSGDNPTKFDEMFRRRLERGQFHMQPYLGCREFPAMVESYAGDPPPLERESRDLGLMLHDIRYSTARNEAVFFNARLEKGVIEVPEWRVA
jgi:CRISPR-associated protein Cas5d